MPYTARIAYDFNNYFYIDSTETYSECVDGIVELLNNPITSFDGLNVSIIKGHPKTWKDLDGLRPANREWREEHFDITSWILQKEGRHV